MTTDLQEAILKELGSGKRNAVKGEVLAKRLGFRDDRLVRSSIRGLIAQGYPILSSVSEPYGYYLAENQEEAKQYMANLKGRLVEDAYCLRDIKRATRGLGTPRQMVLL